MRKFIIKYFIFLLFLISSFAISSTHSFEKQELKKWHKEEVRYIITDEEKDTYKKLTRDEERLKFISQFWKRRDPTPATARNEFFEEYYRRIRNANILFRGEGLKGWLTDRGRIYIMFGPPDEVRNNPVGSPGELPDYIQDSTKRQAQYRPELSRDIGDPYQKYDDSGGTGRAINWGSIIWVYRDLKDPKLGTNVKLVFVNQLGRYTLSTDVDFTPEASIFNARLFDAARQHSFAGKETLEDMKMLETAVEVRILSDVIKKNKPKTDIAIAVNPLYFPTKEKDYMAVAFQFDPSQIHFTPGVERFYAALKIFGSVVQEEGGEIKSVSDFSFPLNLMLSSKEYGEFNEKSKTYWLGFFLLPGDYGFYLGIMDVASNKVGTVFKKLSIPDFKSGGLQLSSILVAKEFIRRESSFRELDKVSELIQFGPLAFRADLKNIFSREEQIELFFFISGYSIDTSTQQPSFSLQYDIMQDDKIIRQIPDKTSNNPSISQPLPLKLLRLEPGEYTINVTVIDNISQKESENSVALILQ